MSNLDGPSLEKLLAITLAHVSDLERERTAMNLRMLELETDRDLAEDERDAAVAKVKYATSAIHAVSNGLRHEAMQASVELLNWASSMEAAGRPNKAAEMRSRSRKIVGALR